MDNRRGIMNIREEKDKSIIIYGAGLVGTETVEKFLCQKMIDKIALIAVTDKDGNPDTIFDIPVKGVGELTDNDRKLSVIIATAAKSQEEIRNCLNELGFQNVYSVNDIEWENNLYLQRYAIPYIRKQRQLCIEQGCSKEETEDILKEATNLLNQQNRLDIARLVVVMGTKCSLRCKECNNLMPHFRPQYDLDKDTIIKSLKTFLTVTDSLLKCELIGGEPFLSKNLESVLPFLLEQKKVKQVEITTNGTILPKKELLPWLTNSKLLVRISDYGELVEQDKCIDFLQNNSVNYEILDGGMWISPGNVEKRGRSKEELRQYYEACFSGYYCKTLFGDKIFSCARAASLYQLGYMKEPEYLEIDERLDADKIKEFMLRDYSEACDYCDMTCENRKLVMPAEQIKKE